jgi:two-component system, chemotaxis family, chemotaxis protein CheY
VPGRTVMVVEDNDAIRQALADLLEDEGYEVRAARNGRDALAQIEERPPAVIVLDIAMPEMNGVELKRRLGASPELQAIPIIVLTASQHSAESYGIDVHAWLQKPFDIAQLFSMIRSLAR